LPLSIAGGPCSLLVWTSAASAAHADGSWICWAEVTTSEERLAELGRL